MHVYMPTERVCVRVCAGIVKWDVEKEPPLSAQTPDPTSERRKKREMLRGREINRKTESERQRASEFCCKVTNASTFLLPKGVQQNCINHQDLTQTNTHTHRYQVCWGKISSPRCVYIWRFRQLPSAAPVCTSSSWPLLFDDSFRDPEPQTWSKQWPFCLLPQPWSETQTHLHRIPARGLALYWDWQQNQPITDEWSKQEVMLTVDCLWGDR